MNARVELPTQVGAGAGTSLAGPRRSGRNGRHPEELIRARDAAGKKILLGAGLALAGSALVLPFYAFETVSAPLSMPKVLPSAVSRNLPVNRSLAAAAHRQRDLDPAATGSVRVGADGSDERLKPQAVALANPPDPKAAARDYVVKGVSQGVALVEGPAGLHEVAPGAALPGAGTVIAIERSGDRWIVVTTEAVIGEAQL